MIIIIMVIMNPDFKTILPIKYYYLRVFIYYFSNYYYNFVNYVFIYYIFPKSYF
jgi:hypothetical protein